MVELRSMLHQHFIPITLWSWLSGCEGSYGTGDSIVRTGRSRRLDSVVVGRVRIESRDANPKNHIGMGRIAAIRGFSDSRQVHGIAAIAHDAKVQVGGTGVCCGPANVLHCFMW